MSKRIITIGRQFGSNGRLIGIALAERLGINCYDKDLIKLASEHTDCLLYTSNVYKRQDIFTLINRQMRILLLSFS